VFLTQKPFHPNLEDQREKEPLRPKQKKSGQKKGEKEKPQPESTRCFSSLYEAKKRDPCFWKKKSRKYWMRKKKLPVGGRKGSSKKRSGKRAKRNPRRGKITGKSVQGDASLR